MTSVASVSQFTTLGPKPQGRQAVPSEIDVVLVFDASPTPEGWVNMMTHYTNTLLPHLMMTYRVPVKVRFTAEISNVYLLMLSIIDIYH